jgi:uncharacterized BrkB/YihY/UPF0761 family membrane protein
LAASPSSSDFFPNADRSGADLIRRNWAAMNIQLATLAADAAALIGDQIRGMTESPKSRTAFALLLAIYGAGKGSSAAVTALVDEVKQIRSGLSLRSGSSGCALALDHAGSAVPPSWLAASYGFGLYVAHFGNYNAAYGSLGGVVVFLTWLYLSAYILLMGGELNSELERQQAKSS